MILVQEDDVVLAFALLCGLITEIKESIVIGFRTSSRRLVECLLLRLASLDQGLHLLKSETIARY